MPIKKLPWKTLRSLIKANLDKNEWPPTAELINYLKYSKSRGWLTKKELCWICFWKSPRAIAHIRSNSDYKIRKLTAVVFQKRTEREKIENLLKLKGVSLPMASAILMLTNPKRYGVIDIRVWEILYCLGEVNTNSKGLRFTYNQWNQYLTIIRQFSKVFSTKARDIDRVLFTVHKKYQAGLLYTTGN